MFKRIIVSIVCIAFSFSNLRYSEAQDFSINQLPVPGTMVGESTPFAPLSLKGLIVNPKKPLEFQFIVDTGKGPQDAVSIKEESNQLIKYFLAGLTIPEGDLWVNLSPYEKNRMVPVALGQTELGRDLLAQDYILKQLTASLIYPEKDLGKEFWSRVYAKAQKQFGTTNVPVNTFNKVWILPDQAQVYENVNAAYVTKSTLKVMLDEDYTALQKLLLVHNSTDSIGSQIVRQIILPEIEKEVNTGKNFAPLRQIYQALILAQWYKETIQNGLLDALYTNKNKVAGVNVNDPAVKEEIYNRYLQAYKKGAFNYIKEDPTPDGQVVPRKYFSGGTFLGKIRRTKGNPADIEGHDGAMTVITIGLFAAGAVGVAAIASKLLNNKKKREEQERIEQQRITQLRVEQREREVKEALTKQMAQYPEIVKRLEKETGIYVSQFFPKAIQFYNEGYDFVIVDDLQGYSDAEEHYRHFDINQVAELGGFPSAVRPPEAPNREDFIKIEQGGILPADTLASLMENAYKVENYSEYNRFSDLLHNLGDPRGQYLYQDNGNMTYEFHHDPNHYTAEMGDGYQLEKWESRWEKVKRSDAAMVIIAKAKIAFWTRTGNVDKIVTMLSYGRWSRGGQTIRKIAMDAIDRLVKEPEKLPILQEVLFNPNDDVRLWAMKEIDTLNIDLEKKLPILVEYAFRFPWDEIGDHLRSWAEDGLRKVLNSQGIKIDSLAWWDNRKSVLMEGIDKLKINSELKDNIFLQIFKENENEGTVKILQKMHQTPRIKEVIEKYQSKIKAQAKEAAEIQKRKKEAEREKAKLAPAIESYLKGRGFDVADHSFDIEGSSVKIWYADGGHGSTGSGGLGGFDDRTFSIITIPLSKIDSAMLETPKVVSKANPLAENGGIDLNQINVLRHGKTVNVQFDPAQLRALTQGGFAGFSFKIESMTRISSPFQLLGINAPTKQVILAKA